MIHFIRPYWLLALIPALFYVLWIFYAYRQSNPWKKVCDPHLLPALIQRQNHVSQLFPLVIIFLFYLLSIFALAGPAWKKTSLPVYKEVSSLLLVLDLSSTMLSNDLQPDRLSRAKFKIRDLIHLSQNTQMGMVVFTGEAFTASPLSQDANTLSAMLEELFPEMMPVAGSNIAQGLSQGLTLLKQASVNQSHIVLITASQPNADSWAIAKNIAETGHRLDIYAMLDSNQQTSQTISDLRDLARTGGGTLFTFTSDNQDIQSILSQNNTKQVYKNTHTENAYSWQDAGPWFCLFLIPLALIIIREKIRHA